MGKTWYTVEEDEPAENFGEMPEKRSVEKKLERGIILLDKPFGPTSNEVTAKIRKKLNLKKAGHFGTLDPNATGVLPVGLNKATRVQELMTIKDKEYIFEAELGDRGDRKKIEEIMESFVGTVEQVPPEKSAVKKEKRDRKVKESRLIDIKEKKILGKVECESGFYIRKLVEEIGERLGTEAKMVELRRTRQSFVHEDELVNIQEVLDEYRFWEDGEENYLDNIIKPVEYAVKDTKKIVIKNSAVNAVSNGADLGSKGISKLQGGIEKGEEVALMTLKGELVALGEALMSSEEMYDREGKAVELEKVHMNPEKYPRRWKQ